MIQVTLYGKSDCHLCEEAEALLKGMSRDFAFTVTRRDITQSPELFERYHLRIPVIEIGGRELDPPHSPTAVRNALRNTNAASS